MAQNSIQSQRRKLAVLRKKLRAAHAAVFTSVRCSLKHAMQAGDILFEAREHVQHGEWLRFLESAGIPERSAQRYMQLARGRERLAANPTFVADMTEALHLLAAPKRRRTSLAAMPAPTSRTLVPVTVAAASPERPSGNVVVQLRPKPLVSSEQERASSSASAVLGVVRHLAEIADEFTAPGDLAHVVESGERETLIEHSIRCQKFISVLLEALRRCLARREDSRPPCVRARCFCTATTAQHSASAARRQRVIRARR